LRISLIFLAGTLIAGPPLQWSDTPLTFEPNLGQTSREVRYLARGSSYDLYFTPGEVQLAAHDRTPLRTRFSGANLAARIVGEAKQPSTTNYFVGNDPRAWRTSVPNYERVRYRDIYPGIDVVYYGKDGHLEYDWIVGPGADPSKIRMIVDNADRLAIDAGGDLVINAGRGQYRHKRPVIYQEIGGKRVPVAGRWELSGKESGFHIGQYDRSKALVIDPPLVYSTYYGGTGLDYAFAVAVDSVGNTYVAGSVGSADLGVSGAEDAFVTKLNPSGGRMYTTFIGGHASDEAHGIAVDVQGSAYVTGSSGSLDFPIKNGFQTTTGGSGDAFVVKLDGRGSMVYSTYLGGSGIDAGSAIAVDGAGNAYVIGSTFSSNFPTQAPFQAAKGAQEDAFVTKINAAGALVYSTYLGGNNVDQGNGIAVDGAGNAYVTGYTASTDFPLQSPFRGSNQNSVDAFVAKLNPAGSALVYSTYLGGSATDYGNAIAIDASGSAYVTGAVTSEDFPLVNPINLKLGSHAVNDAFITKLNPSGSSLVYSTYFGGASDDEAYAIALDQAGNAYITGRTNSSDFPLTNPIQATRFAFDMFVTEIDATGSGKLFSTFIGGTGSESGRGIAVDKQGNIHVAGEGTSTDFPVMNAMQASNGGGSVTQDALVLMLGTAAGGAGGGGSVGPVITTVSDSLIDGGPIVPGGWFYVKGSNLSDTTRIWGSADFTDPNMLPTDLNGVEVWVNGAPVPVYYISPTQVNAQAPTNITGTMTVQVIHLGLASNILISQVAQIQPSIYYYQVNSKNYAAALFLDYSLMGDPGVVPGTRKAKAGEAMFLYAAGLGAAPSGGVITSPVQIDGVSLAIGTANVQVSWAGLVAPGQFQINFVVPQLPDGEYTVTVSRDGKTSPSNVLFEIGQ
jgi:uncharacterized protein (TIGR03437 family)